jgi:tetratricopeptide (TPR) repeat protein
MKHKYIFILALSVNLFCGCDFFAKHSAGAYYVAKGVAAEKGKKYSLALDCYSKAIKLEPKNPAGYELRGSLLQKMNDTSGALADYNNLIRIDPKSSTAYNLRGLVETDQNKLDSALADFNVAIHYNEKFAYAYNNLSYVEYEKLDTLNAFADNKKSLQLDSNNSWAYVYRGLMRLKFLHDTVDAIYDYDKALTKPNRYARAYIEKGKVIFYRGDKELACEYFQTAKDSGYNGAEIIIKTYCGYTERP